jgi:molybdopterin-guanine dinucleotide biosynthesis protein
MAPPLVVGVVGDSAAGKTTLVRRLLRVLGHAQTTLLNAGDCREFAVGTDLRHSNSLAPVQVLILLSS